MFEKKEKITFKNYLSMSTSGSSRYKCKATACRIKKGLVSIESGRKKNIITKYLPGETIHGISSASPTCRKIKRVSAQLEK